MARQGIFPKVVCPYIYRVNPDQHTACRRTNSESEQVVCTCYDHKRLPFTDSRERFETSRYCSRRVVVLHRKNLTVRMQKDQ